jgi:pimeloyl-ACP methyl ester carboxylesterase
MHTITSKDGTRIAFDRDGDGPALVLVGGASTTRVDLAPLAMALAPFFTVLAYDRRGRGDSGDTAPYAVEREVDDIEALVDATGGSAFLFGHSSGAVLALEAARLLPYKVTKLAIYEPPFIIDDSHPHVPADFSTQLAGLVSSGQRGEAVAAFMRFVGTPEEMVVQMRQSPIWPHMEASAQSFVYDVTIVEDTERGDPASLRKWESTQVPTLILDGTVFMGSAEAHAFMRHGADELAGIIPYGYRRTLEGQDHGPASEVLVPALWEFFLGRQPGDTE